MVTEILIDNSLAAFEQNAFRVLALCANADAKEVYRKQQRVRNALELGDPDVAGPFTFLPGVDLSPETVLNAVHRIERQRMVEELFWVHATGGLIDFDAKTPDPVLTKLRSEARQNSTKGSIAQHNLAVILGCLAQGMTGARRLHYWSEAICCWNDTLTNNVFWDFLEDRRTLAEGPSRAPGITELQTIVRGVLQHALAKEGRKAVHGRRFNELFSFITIIRENRALVNAESILEAVKDQVVENSLSEIGLLVDRIGTVTKDANKQATEDILVSVETDLQLIAVHLDEICKAFGEDSLAELRDTQARALRELSVAYFNFLDDAQAALRLAMESGAVARDPGLKRDSATDCKFIQRMISCQKAQQAVEQKNFAAAEAELANALALSNDAQRTEILEWQKNVQQLRQQQQQQLRWTRLLHNVDQKDNSPSLSTFNGIGTIFYGSRDFDPETKSYITVHWFVFIMIPIFPLGCYRVSNRGGNTFKVYGRVVLTPFLSKYRWAVMAAFAIFALYCMLHSGTSDGARERPVNVTDPTSRPATSDPQTRNSSTLQTSRSPQGQSEAIETERSELRRLSALLDQQKQEIDEQSAELKQMQDEMASMKEDFVDGTISEDAKERYNAVVFNFNSKLPSHNSAVRRYNADLRRYQERIAAFNERVRRYNASQ